jgi:hypothetical protein
VQVINELNALRPLITATQANGPRATAAASTSHARRACMHAARACLPVCLLACLRAFLVHRA